MFEQVEETEIMFTFQWRVHMLILFVKDKTQQ